MQGTAVLYNNSEAATTNNMATLRTRLILILAICVTIQTYMTVVVVVLSAREFSAASLALFFIY